MCRCCRRHCRCMAWAALASSVCVRKPPSPPRAPEEREKLRNEAYRQSQAQEGELRAFFIFLAAAAAGLYIVAAAALVYIRRREVKATSEISTDQVWRRRRHLQRQRRRQQRPRHRRQCSIRAPPLPTSLVKCVCTVVVDEKKCDGRKNRETMILEKVIWPKHQKLCHQLNQRNRRRRRREC